MSFSDYIVYVDESGDHGMENINPYYPIFVLAFCIFKKTDYISKVVPALQSFKFNYWGHDAVVLHEHEIRKSMGGNFSLLNDNSVRTSFMNALSKIIETTPLHVITTVLHKEKHRSRYTSPENPYHLSLEFCLERLRIFLKENNVNIKTQTTHLIFESRGKQEDDALELAFRRIMDRELFSQASFVMRFVSKNANCSGLQLADLIARPVGLHVLRPTQANRAFEIIKKKLFAKNGSYQGYGLKIFP
jgi:hypothetical protein